MSVWLHAVLRLGVGSGPEDVRRAYGDEGPARAALATLGGTVWGLWHGAAGIGLRSDEIVLSVVLPDDAAAGAATERIGALPAVDGVQATPLHPTVRPVDPAPVSGDGLWVFRDFEIARTDAERFVELSEEAWASFETRFDARIDGLFRAPDPDPERAHLLLVTRYADFATWEASRAADADPEAWARFTERRALTRWTRARSAPRLPL